MAKIIAGCKHCGHLFKIEELFEGIDVECPKCGEMVVVSKVADRDEQGLPVFSEDMDQILDQIYKKADEMEGLTNMEQLEDMAETLEVKQEDIQRAAAAKAAARPPSKKIAPERPATKYKITKPKKSRKKLVALVIFAIIIIAGGVFAWKKYDEQKRFQEEAEKLLTRAQGQFDTANYSECLKMLRKFKQEYAESKVASKAQNLRQLAEVEHEAKKLMDEAGKLHKEGKLPEAIAKVGSIISKYADSKQLAQAKKLKDIWSHEKAGVDAKKDYERAEALYVEGKYHEALLLFEPLAQGNWPFSADAKERAEGIKIYEKEGQELYDSAQEARGNYEFDKAVKLYNEVISRYKHSKAASMAGTAVEETQKEKERHINDNFNKHMAAAKQFEAREQYRNAWQEVEEARKWKPTDKVALAESDKLRRLADLFENMIKITAGPFAMGSDASDPDENPKHNVNLQEYYISKYPVTNEEYKRFVDKTEHRIPYVNAKWAKPYNWRRTPQGAQYPAGKGKHPVVLVSYDDAKAYCKWIGKRLPTEAEWEKAARGQNGNLYPWGPAQPSSRLCNFANTVRGTSDVGTYRAGRSPFEAEDMAGNVWEWCEDSYDKDFYRDPKHGNNPLCVTNTGLKVIRGGCWVSQDDILRCSNRHARKPDTRLSTIGFRTALTPE